MWWLKNCCNFSLTKLMEICSKPLYSKISNPAMSSTAQKLAFFWGGTVKMNDGGSKAWVSYQGCIDQRVIALDDQPFEDSVEDGTSDATDSSCCLLTGLTWIEKKKRGSLKHTHIYVDGPIKKIFADFWKLLDFENILKKHFYARSALINIKIIK